MKKRTKVCAVASAGGHLTQLLKLVDSWGKDEAVYVSTSNVVAKRLSLHGRTYIVDECNRNHPFKSLHALGRCLVIIVKERPTVVISTGAEPGFLLCMTGKLIGAKVIWVDSIANVKRLSLSGRLIRPFTDLFLTQWPDLVNKNKHIEYAGELI